MGAWFDLLENSMKEMPEEPRVTQCKHIPDWVVLDTALRCSETRGRALYDALREDHPSWPTKVVWTKIERLVDRGLLEYGTSPRTSWLTGKGHDALRAEKTAYLALLRREGE